MASLLDALSQVESSNRFGIVGPKTPYGQALGGFQMLSGTAEEMARKQGLPWRADLMTSPTQEGQQYQRQLADAYVKEGLARTGNIRDALRYYHGGPNRDLWGPKTDAHAEKVLALAGPDAWKESQPMAQQPTSLAQILNPQQQRMAQYDQPMQVGNPAPPVEAPLGIASAPDQFSGVQMPQMAETPQIKPGAFDKGGNGWVLAGIIADAIAGGFGGKGGFAPMYAQTQQDNRALEQWREELAAKREATLAKAAEPPQFVQDAAYLQQHPELIPAVNQMYDIRNPNIVDVQTTQGTFRQMVPRTSPGVPQQAVSDLRSAVAQGDQAAIAEFEQVFGPGSAQAALGQ